MCKNQKNSWISLNFISSRGNGITSGNIPSLNSKYVNNYQFDRFLHKIYILCKFENFCDSELFSLRSKNFNSLNYIPKMLHFRYIALFIPLHTGPYRQKWLFRWNFYASISYACNIISSKPNIISGYDFRFILIILFGI